ncbi:MAG: tetratricopeptide repeat protein [Chloroflexi bacterium]|nr:tetratricopeptide repeat protein [Ardenticatenaceae bacterium]NOG34277.1 tetratricopeptide repeat protein [Chloroflexota bacterium]GIK56391.1 MAG: hypothetical protein BroJett015_20540 [Chloroflexota bacterium]
MTTITLQEYHERIEKLIDENMLTEAVAHCRHILESYPSHIRTYRLLAKALLEQHDYDGATDLFQRVLSADPNDFVAHVGLSIVRAEESQVEDALWHLQRAFEIEPYNAAIQEELRHHYAQFSDMAVDRIPLTSGALARLYIKGELYQQAVQELRQAIQQSQDRVDLEVLLAEALWRNEQRVDAEEVCLNVLQKLPNCIAVNAVLSDIWLQTGRIGESQKYLRRLVNLTSPDKASLDLDTAVGRAFRAEGAPALPDKVEIEFKGDGLATPAAAAARGPSADWMNDVTFDSDMGEKFDYKQLDVVGESPSGMHSYDWMADVNDDLTSAESLPVESEWFVDEVLQAEPALEDDWLSGIELAAVETAVAGDDFDLLFPDDDFAPLDADVVAEPEPEDWFLAQSESELEPEETFASEQLAPDWLVSLVDEPDIPDLGGEKAAADISSDWFGDSGHDEPLSVAETNMPDWLSNLVDDGASVPAASDFAVVELAPVGTGDQDDWIIDERAEDQWDEPGYTAEEMPDWLQDVAAFDASEGVAAEPEAGDALAVSAVGAQMPAGGMPDWLLKQTGELESEMAAATGGEAFDDWLGGDAGMAVETPEPKEDSPFAGWLSDEPEPVKGTAALGLTAMFASLDDDLPEAAETPAAQMNEWDDLFGEVSEMAGTAVPPTPPQTDLDADDWLSGLEEAIDEIPAAEPDTAVSLNDLRALFTDKAADEAAEAAEFSLDSDWLSQAEDIWAGDLLADDLSDLAVETTDVAAEFAQTFGEQAYLDEDLAGAEEKIPDWLLGNDQASVGKAEDRVMGMMGDEEEAALPEQPESEDDFASLRGDWFSEFTGGDQAEAFDDDDELDVTPGADEVPDWLVGFEMDTAGEAEEAADQWMAAAVPDGTPFADAAFEDEEVPDWLTGFAGTAVTDEPPAMPSRAAAGDSEEADELFDVLADMSASESPLADWLADDDFASFEDGPDEELVAGTAVPGGGLTSWLSSLPADEPAASSEPDYAAAADIPEIPSEELFATDQSNLPDWLSPATGDLIVTAEEESNLPDWLMGNDGDAPAQLDSEDLFATDEADAFGPPAELEELEAGLSFGFEEAAPEEAVDEGLTAVDLTALFSSIHDEPATLAGLGAETDMDWLVGMGEEEPASALEVADEVELDWLAEESVMAEMETAVIAAPEPGLEDVGLDASGAGLDDAISWLEELASQQETPVEELPTVAENLLAEELTAVEMDALVRQDMMGEAFDNEEAFDVAEMFDAAFDDVLDEAWQEAFPADLTPMSAADDVLAEEEEAEGESWLDVLMADEETQVTPMPAPPEDDTEAAMAWLEELAARQGALLEELPTLQDRSLDGLVDEAQADLDDALAWMNDLAEEPETKEEWPELDEELLATMIAGTAVAPSSKAAALPPKQDDELAEALNFLDEQVKAEGITAAVSGGTAVVSDAELMAALDWLEESSVADQTVVIDEPAEPEPLEMASEWELADALALADEPQMDRMDALVAAEMTIGDGLAEAELWDDESWDWEQPESITDLLTVTAKPSTSLPSDAAAAELALLDMPDDPDAAMEWLARFGADEGEETTALSPTLSMPAWEEPAEDKEREMDETWIEPVGAVLPTAVAGAITQDEMGLLADDLDIDDMPDDPDAAMNWLLDMAQGDASIDFDMEPPPISPSEDAKFAIDYGEPARTISAEPEIEMDTAVADVRADADEAFMAGMDTGEDEGWLEDMLGDDFMIDFDMEPPPISPSEDAKFAIDYGEPATTVMEPAAEISSLAGLAEEDIIAAVPEDPDEAMAWLQKIADEQTGSLEPAIAPDDALLPAWLTGEETDVEAFGSLSADETELSLMDDLGVDMADDLSDSLPDWLAADDERSSSTGQTGWLTAVEDLDVISWLVAEEEATTVDFDDAIISEVAEVRPSAKPATGRLPSLTPAEPEMPAESFEVKRLAADELSMSQLSDVRVVLAEKRYEEAAAHYHRMIVSGTATLGLIAELESLADEYPAQPAFRRLLGDAYMRNGQLQKALNTYRMALDQL